MKDFMQMTYQHEMQLWLMLQPIWVIVEHMDHLSLMFSGANTFFYT